MVVRKAVIPAAGMGTRLLPATKEQPKEMLPVFAMGLNGQGCLKPLLQLVFEQLFDAGFREFCFVIGRGKRAIQDHFTQDYEFAEMLKHRGKASSAAEMGAFYGRLDRANILWVSQAHPRGFGDAVLMARSAVGLEDFLVHAGDTYIASKGCSHLERLRAAFEEFDADAVFAVKKTEEPSQKGIVDVEPIREKVYRVKRAVEKPDSPSSNLAIEPLYFFKPSIFEVLSHVSPGKGGEIQLTDGIQRLVDRDANVLAIELNKDEARLDIGSPETYWDSLRCSYEKAARSHQI